MINTLMDGLTQAALDAGVLALATFLVFLGIRVIGWLADAL